MFGLGQEGNEKEESGDENGDGIEENIFNQLLLYCKFTFCHEGSGFEERF